MRLLKSALFWRILLSSLLVVGVLGIGLYRASRTHEELYRQFDLLVRHDLDLADDAEEVLRRLAEMEAGKQGYLLTRDPSRLKLYEDARKELVIKLADLQKSAALADTDPERLGGGKETSRVQRLQLLADEWVKTVSDPQVIARESSKPLDLETVTRGETLTDQMRTLGGELRSDAVASAEQRETDAFAAAAASRRETTTLLVIAIVIALASGVWIARDLAGATRALEEALLETGELKKPRPLPARRDELGSVGRSLEKMADLLLEKDATLRATLHDREEAVKQLTRANSTLERRDAGARTYAEFVRQLKTLDVNALATSGLLGLVRLAQAQLGVVYLLDGANRIVPVHATTADARALEHKIFASDGLPRMVIEKHEAVLLKGEELGDAKPRVDLGVAQAPLKWVLAQPIAVGSDAAGALVVAGLTPFHAGEGDEELVRDAARQLAVGLHNAWTHDRLREKSVMLAEQGDTLARANKVKTEFLASMSHELRTPLSAMLGFADLLLTSPKESLSPRARESLERIKRNGEHLLSLINDVLDLAKAEAGRVDVRLAAVNVTQLARSCAAEVDSLRLGKDMKLVVDVPDPAIETMTDAQRVRQILLNLLSNAIKFTEHGEVTLTVRGSTTDVRLSVKDTGIGIRADAIAELFQEFHQLDAGDGKRYDGTGVGLALSRRLARALGGEIEVRSREREGSTFTLVLPYVAPTREEPAALSTASPDSRILS